MSYADLLRRHAAEPALASREFLRFEDATWTFAETLRDASAYANLFLERRDVALPLHVGLLLENRPEFVLAQLGAGLCGAVIVGLQSKRQPRRPGSGHQNAHGPASRDVTRHETSTGRHHAALPAAVRARICGRARRSSRRSPSRIM